MESPTTMVSIARELQALAQYERDLEISEELQLSEVLQESLRDSTLSVTVERVDVSPSLATVYAEQASEAMSLAHSQNLKRYMMTEKESQPSKDCEFARMLQDLDVTKYDIDQ